MVRLLSLLLILAISIYAQSDSEILKRADGFMKSTSKSNHFRAYNDYKNLYLRAIMSEDSKLRINSLKGIVKSGNKLHIDVSQYSDELSKIKPKTSYQTPVPKPMKTSSQAKNIKLQSSHKLKSVRWKDDKLILKFDNKLRSNQINYFTLYDSKNERYRYIFDIQASMLTESQTLRKNDIDRIELAQYNTNTLRLVVENSQKVEISFKKDSNQLVVHMLSKSSDKYSKAFKTIVKSTIPLRADRNKTIVIDAGHGGKDPGAVGYRNYREKVVVFKIAQELKNILKSRGYKVYMTRDRDKFVKLSNRTEYANIKKADIFVSIHANAVGRKNANKAQGVECYFLSPSRSERAEKVAAKENSADLSDMNRYGKDTFLNFLNSHKIVASNKLAIDLQRGMLGSVNKNYRVRDGGVREGPFWVLVGAQMPAVLVEVGFISHPEEAKRLVDDKYRKTMALGLANGIERYFAKN
ncbi:N-acetylmuramoyl-L-alanine amidase [Sulfurimonas gotlandica GD1]|uniref:N-acetylmuramoyl-L-alanine amidase n=1 Tax=Sulfurimonas gotlandica (strain DSM 19862 / JCM 16533 / GD1) TaxID=929558 RepID=B6BNW6_SULGG|nr:N-acetylmuramoyl-L-alanine amidase [Sulfurimonas gotlandica]EDZ61286.1 N-acetylmuramoyl-L-alanine amidase [Sulfurimonas gotlandica GD1]EHP28920.1 N-acetylmuramoyl-L-alanine amidase [Sulfurimonas gotlandica GD1]